MNQVEFIFAVIGVTAIAMTWLFVAHRCNHKWNVHASGTYSITADRGEREVENGIREVLICEHCGKIKKIEY